MTEAEWLTTDMSLYMLREYPAEWNSRKACLVACGCLQSHQLFPADMLIRQYVQVVEEIAEGRASNKAWWPLWKAIRDAAALCKSVEEHDHRRYALLHSFIPPPDRDGLIRLFTECLPLRNDAETKIAQCNLLRDIFGNPFRQVTFSPGWRTSTVESMASQMYEDRDFTAISILADALQDARCENAAILSHCRGPGPHVRGCWVVDAILSKE
jgi:hypothetical protein